MRQRKILLVMVLLAAVLTGGMFGKGSAVVQAKTTGYKFIWNRVTVYMGGPAKKLIEKAGEPERVKAAKSCAYDGKDRTYQYKDFILYTYSDTDNGPEYINGITFLTKKPATKEKIRIGSSYSKVKKKYGNKRDSFGVYTYKKGGSKLQIEVTDDVVTNIRYIKS